MKIFIIGAEGSGKTVFLAMLSRYLNTHGGGLILEPADYRTSQYIVEVQHTLEQGEWPASTRMGQSFVMKYRFGIVGKTNHDLLMYDAAGQDLRSLILTEELEDLSAEDKAALAAAKATPGDHMSTLRDQIHGADALVYLLDLESLLAIANPRAQNEHCWLLKTFLAHPRWKDKKRIVLLSKKDKYEALLAESGNDVRMCIRAHLPSFYSISHYLDHKNVSFAAISSVAAETFIDEDGTPSRRPCRPFRPGDMSGAAGYLAELAREAPPLPRNEATAKGTKPSAASSPAKTKGSRWAVLLTPIVILVARALMAITGPFTSPPVDVEFRSSRVPGGGQVLVLRNQSSKSLTGYVLKIARPGGQSFGPYRMGDLPPSQTAELGWLELNNWVLQSGDEVSLSFDGFSEKRARVP